MIRNPILIPLDMSLANNHTHPQICTKKQYMCLIGKNFFCGTFNKQHYGYNFTGWYGSGLQFDAPGTNHSEWVQIWEIFYIKE